MLMNIIEKMHLYSLLRKWECGMYQSKEKREKEDVDRFRNWEILCKLQPLYTKFIQISDKFLVTYVKNFLHTIIKCVMSAILMLIIVSEWTVEDDNGPYR
ncbi:hypothetical protein E2542_SST31469 [Spatholobus suberectus]|nr:hypothetical protein E2542_SST31469 [Spatholobus suberectus]